MWIITNRNIFFILTSVLVCASVASIIVFGLSTGADFTGGTFVEVRYAEGRPDARDITQLFDERGFSGYSLREAGANGYIVRAGNLTPEERAALPSVLSRDGMYASEIVKLTEVGPTIGAELRNKAAVALVLVLLGILFFIAFAFRKVSEPVSSWVYGSAAILGLMHNVIVILGFFALLGYLMGAQIDTLFLTAMLTIMGYSVHDTIVVFDRTRENLRINKERNRREDFAETAGRSLKQTLVRSINTSLTTALVLIALFLLGPESTKVFSLTLLAGVIVGTYASVFLATPLLVAWEKYRAR